MCSFISKKNRAFVSIGIVVVMSIINLIALSALKISENSRFSSNANVHAEAVNLTQESQVTLIDRAMKDVFEISFFDSDSNHLELDLYTYLIERLPKDILLKDELRDNPQNQAKHASKVFKNILSDKINMHLHEFLPSELRVKVLNMSSASESNTIEFDVELSDRDLKYTKSVLYSVNCPQFTADDMENVKTGNRESVCDLYSSDLVKYRF